MDMEMIMEIQTESEEYNKALIEEDNREHDESLSIQRRNRTDRIKNRDTRRDRHADPA